MNLPPPPPPPPPPPQPALPYIAANPTPTGGRSYAQPSPQRHEHTFQPPKGYKLRRKRRWPWVLLALVVILIIGAVLSKPKDDTTSSPGDTPNAPSVLGVGGTGTTSGLQVTLMQVVDPWTSGNAFETPSVGQRFVAVELTITNTTDEMQTFSTLLGLEVRDASGQRWNAGLYGLDLPQLGGDIPPGGLMRGWQVFEVGDGGGALQLVVKGSLTATGTTFQL